MLRIIETTTKAVCFPSNSCPNNNKKKEEEEGEMDHYPKWITFGERESIYEE